MTEEAENYSVDTYGITDEQAKAFLKKHEGKSIDEIFEELVASLIADGLYLGAAKPSLLEKTIYQIQNSLISVLNK